MLAYLGTRNIFLAQSVDLINTENKTVLYGLNTGAVNAVFVVFHVCEAALAASVHVFINVGHTVIVKVTAFTLNVLKIAFTLKLEFCFFSAKASVYYKISIASSAEIRKAHLFRSCHAMASAYVILALRLTAITAEISYMHTVQAVDGSGLKRALRDG